MKRTTEDGFEFVSIIYPFNKLDAIRITDEFPVEKYIEYIRANNIEQAEIIMPDLKFLKDCPTLKYFRICPSENAPADFDFAPLYEMPEIRSLNCQNRYGSTEQYISKIDYSKISNLTDLFVGVNKGTLNYNQVKTLKSLRVGSFKGRHCDLTDLFCSEELDTLQLIGCQIVSLDGIEKAPGLQCLYIQHNRRLKNISALYKVRKTLKALRIENCPKIEDCSVLGELERLELLELSGSNTLPNLNFLKSMRRLKTFVFNLNVLDGDLSACKRLSYVYSEKDRKHYNLKNADLPKGQYIRGNETIESWRRLE